MNDLAIAIPHDAVPGDADQHSGPAVSRAQDWVVYHLPDPDSEESGFCEAISFSDIDDAIVAIEDRAEFDRELMGSQIPGAVLIAWQTSRDGVQHNVYKMPLGKTKDQTRYRD
jgi:hypothetical protein